MPNVDLEKLKTRGKDLLDGFTTGQKVVTVVALVAVLAFAYIFTTMTSDPSYATLYSNLSPDDAAKVTETLKAEGVPYKLAQNGTAVLVPQKDVYQARIDLSAKNLPAGGSEGFSLIDKQGITTSEFRQRIDYQRALQGELEKTIRSMDDVANASVMVTIPKDDVFTDDNVKTTASVLITPKPGQKLTSTQVQAVVHLVASSVPNLTPENVTVADSTGRVLSTNDGAGAAALDDNDAKTAAYESKAGDSIASLLAPVTGANAAVVRVNATLDFDQKATTAERYELPTPTTTPGAPPTSVPPSDSSTSAETYTGPGSSPSGVLGPDGTAGTTGGTGTLNYSKTTETQKMPYGKVTEQVRNAPGTVERLSIAVLVDANKVAAGDVAQIEQTVAAAAGLDNARGDTLQITRLPFDTSADKEAKKQAAAAQANATQSMIGNVAKTVGALFLVVLVVFIAWRMMKKSAARQPLSRVPLDMQQIERAAQKQRLELAEEEVYKLSAVDDLPSLEAAPDDETGRVHDSIADMIDRQPDEVATTLRGWLADRRA